MAKMYWFSMSKYSHDLFFRMNRLKNTIDDMVLGENEVDSLCELKHQLDLSHTTINLKAINKITKEEPFIVPII